MKPAFRIPFVFFLLTVVISACTKADHPSPPNPGGSKGDTASAVLSGNLYVDADYKILKINVVDTTTVWEAANINFAGSAGAQMDLDSSVLYASSVEGVLGIDRLTGNARFFLQWPNFTASGINSYNAPVANDSLVFIVSPTNGANIARLHCITKNNGTLKWQQSIDSASIDYNYSTVAAVAGDKVVVVTLDARQQRHLTAFRVSDGARIWSTGPDDYLPSRLRTDGNFIYSTSGETVVCYNATDGSVKWKVDLATYDFWRSTGTFFEDGHVVLVRVADEAYNIYTINIADGKMIKQVRIPAPPTAALASGCAYSNDKLVITSKYLLDSASVRMYDLTTGTMTWEKRYEHQNGPYDRNMPAPLLANGHILYPTLTGVEDTILMHFLDMKGNEVKTIPYVSGGYADRFAYEEKGVVYSQDNRLVP